MNPHANDRIGTIQQLYDGALMPDIQVNTLRNIERLFATATVRHGAAVLPLPAAAKSLGDVGFDSGGKRYDLYDYVSLNRVSGLLVIKDGRIAHESYQFGNTPQTRWTSMSLAKSITATLVGVAIQDGYIECIDDPIVQYLPALEGSAYDGVSVRDLLQMASGVGWNETYTDPLSDRRRMLEVQGTQTPGGVLKLMAKLPRVAAPGTRWNYSTGETHVVGALVRAAVGKPVSQYLSERIWSRVGMESDASWWLESPNGLEVGGSGLSATLRDYGRFGLFLLDDGLAGGERVLPNGWIEEASSPKIINGEQVDYGYMLWPIADTKGTPNESAFEARGIFGQHLYMNPRAGVVIVVWGALPKPKGMAPIKDDDFFAAVVEALGP
ncbi:serine hydrolase domain-containing protein [Pseudomonas sp. SST3]|uniref:serine hydrolase domain-containing protein n=1 Tax=Pseudomonas sp. SST3 TaxID=2267882 RepID=UPI0026D9BA4F